MSMRLSPASSRAPGDSRERMVSRETSRRTAPGNLSWSAGPSSYSGDPDGSGDDSNPAASGLMAFTIRSRSPIVANSTVIFPFRCPSSTLTRVSNRSERRSARWRRAGARGGLTAVRAGRRDGESSAPIATISSTARTERPSATIRVASRSCASGFSTRGRGVARAEPPRRDAFLNGRRQVQQPQGIADMRARPAYLAREFFVGSAEIIEELLVGRGLFQRVELLAVQVLDQGVSEQVVVLGLLDDRADLGQPGPLGGPPPAFAHDELVPAGSGGANHHRLQETDLPDGFGELVEGVLVEGPPRLPGIRHHRGDRDVPVVRARDLEG